MFNSALSRTQKPLTKMKKIILMLGIVMILVAGCNDYEYPTIPKLQYVSPEEIIISQNQNITQIRFFIDNPIINTVAVNISYHINKDCLNVVGKNNDYYEVYPKTKWAVIKEFDVKNTEECLQSPTYVQVYLRDVGGDLRDSLNYRIQIV